MATPNRNRFANRVLTMRYHTVVKFGLIIGVIMNLPYAMSGVSAILGIENSNNSEFSIGSPENFLFWFLFALIIAAITFQIKAFIEHLRWGRNFIKYLFTVYTLNLILPVLNIFTSVASEAYEQAVQAIVTLIVYLIWIIPIAVYYNKRKHMFDGVKKVL
ncbi:hypothetical protein FACS1894217_11840 [Clostridia bacterium]|nr:hypothetical protein FACS1894217_11840 [Clostridia bacterium]